MCPRTFKIIVIQKNYTPAFKKMYFDDMNWMRDERPKQPCSLEYIRIDCFQEHLLTSLQRFWYRFHSELFLSCRLILTIGGTFITLKSSSSFFLPRSTTSSIFSHWKPFFCDERIFCFPLDLFWLKISWLYKRYLFNGGSQLPR